MVFLLGSEKLREDPEEAVVSSQHISKNHKIAQESVIRPPGFVPRDAGCPGEN